MKILGIRSEIRALSHELVSLRRDFHAHPELGFCERRTAKIVEDYLLSLGLEVTRCAKTGVVGLLRGTASGKTIMLRCDMDALPIEEQTDLPFKSLNPGVMHACGHDGHVAMLLVAAKVLSQHRTEFSGTIKFVFQPNEEEAGAGLMIAEGVLENPTCDAAFGLHLWSPISTGKIGIVSGPIMASSYYFKLTISGKGGHGGAPHTAINPIDVATHVLEAIRSFQTSENNALDPMVVSIGSIHAGTKAIIIPEVLEMEGSIRCLHHDDAVVRERMKKRIEHVCEAHRCSGRLEYQCGNSMLNNDPEMTTLAMKVAALVVGEENLQTQDVRVMLGDDFAEFSNKIPGVYCFVGTGNVEKRTNIEHHNPQFDIDEDSLPIGAEMYVRLALEYLKSS